MEVCMKPGRDHSERRRAVQALIEAIQKSGAPSAVGSVLELAHLRAGQINSCAVGIVGGVGHAREAGESDERLSTVAAWRETPYFTDAERAALARRVRETAVSTSGLDPSREGAGEVKG